MHFLSVSVETLFGQTYNFNLSEAKEVWIVATFSPIGRIIDALLKSIRNEKIKLFSNFTWNHQLLLSLKVVIE